MAATYQFKPVWRNMSTQQELSVEQMQQYVNYVFRPCVAVVVGPSIIVQRNRTTSEILGAPTNASLAQREVLEGRLLDAKASHDYAAVQRLEGELGATGTILEKKNVLRVHQDTYKHLIWLNKVCFEYVAETDKQVDSDAFEAQIHARITISVELQAKVCASFEPEPEQPKPVPVAASSSTPPEPVLERYPAPFSFNLYHMEIKPDTPYHILSASNLDFRLSKNAAARKHDSAVVEREVTSTDLCQKVSFVPQGDNKWLILSWTKPEWALDVQGAGMGDNTRVQFWSKVHKRPNQQFRILRSAEGRAFIQAQHSDLWIKHQTKQVWQGIPTKDDEAFHWIIIPAGPASAPAAGQAGLFSRVSGASCV